MNEQQVKELGKEIRELLPDNTTSAKIEAHPKGGKIKISYKDEENSESTIKTLIPAKQ